MKAKNKLKKTSLMSGNFLSIAMGLLFDKMFPLFPYFLYKHNLKSLIIPIKIQ